MSACTECGKNLALVGRVHRCVPRVTLEKRPVPVPVKAKVDPARAVSIKAVANSPVANRLANTNSTTYQHRDPEARRAYQRDLMRKRRAAAKAATK